MAGAWPTARVPARPAYNRLLEASKQIFVALPAACPHHPLFGLRDRAGLAS